MMPKSVSLLSKLFLEVTVSIIGSAILYPIVLIVIVITHCKNYIKNLVNLIRIIDKVTETKTSKLDLLIGLWLCSIEKPWVIPPLEDTSQKQMFPKTKFCESYRALCYSTAVYGYEGYLYLFGYINSFVGRLMVLSLLPQAVFSDLYGKRMHDKLFKTFVPDFISHVAVRFLNHSDINLQNKNVIKNYDHCDYRCHDEDNKVIPCYGVYIDEAWPTKEEKKDGDISVNSELVNDNYCKALVIVIRGSSSIGDWLTDFTFTPPLIDNDGNYGKVHFGIFNQAKLLFEEDSSSKITKTKIRQILDDDTDKTIKKLIITGHSLGGGIAIYLTKFYYEYFKSINYLHRININGYTYGAPSCVDINHFSKWSYGVDDKVYLYNFVHGLDIISRISLGSINELKDRSLLLLNNNNNLNVKSIFFYTWDIISGLLLWIFYGNDINLINRGNLAFPNTSKEYYEVCSDYNKYKNNMLYLPQPVYLLYNNPNRYNIGKISNLDPIQHLSTIFWSPISALFSHSPFYYLRILNDLKDQYQFDYN